MPQRFTAHPEQAAAFPVRTIGRELQVCLIRRKRSTTWGIPKGLVDPGRTHEEAALIEAHEEAGLKGRVLGPPIGTFQYRKWDETLTVAVFVMEVLHQEQTWKEVAFRERRWTSFPEAVLLLAAHPAAALLDRAHALVTAGRYRL